ncbi:hypothetical protein AVEN_4662-1 [Araneus ventricosus]|uniref:Mos1 transposase HTH domain-containing protein n=1 Tax=Araneus ventricosus TaxID=182803 RepID=A0A4Y2I0I7_ARAVE|nr:hypothetical protein AVEN_4662-1 [Araneus ventricosus]
MPCHGSENKLHNHRRQIFKNVHKSDICMQNYGDFRAKKEHFLEVLLLYFIVKKNADESYRILRDAYGEDASHHRKTRVNAGLNGLG